MKQKRDDETLLVQVPDLSKNFQKFLKKLKEEIPSGINAANTVGDKKFKCFCKALEALVSIVETGNFNFEFKFEKSFAATLKDKGSSPSRSKYRNSFFKKITEIIQGAEKQENSMSEIEKAFFVIVNDFIQKFEKGNTYETELKTFRQELIALDVSVKENEMVLQETGAGG